MKKIVSVLPDISALSEREKDIFAFIVEHWPTSALEIAAHFKEDLATREKKRRASTKYSYYVQKLVAKELVISKRSGNSLIVWPLVVEKYRTIHGILREYELESSHALVDMAQKVKSESLNNKSSALGKEGAYEC